MIWPCSQRTLPEQDPVRSAQGVERAVRCSNVHDSVRDCWPSNDSLPAQVELALPAYRAAIRSQRIDCTIRQGSINGKRSRMRGIAYTGAAMAREKQRGAAGDGADNQHSRQGCHCMSEARAAWRERRFMKVPAGASWPCAGPLYLL